MKCRAIENASLTKPSRGDLIWAEEMKASWSPSNVVSYFDLIKFRNTLSTELVSLKAEAHFYATKNNFELYRAFRDCLEPRSRQFPVAEIWRADLISYSGEWLPDDEPCRSIGHWNPPDQSEVFEVLLGHVTMLVLSPSGGIEVLECLPGAAWSIPRGSFHLTYASCPSLVINIYNTDGYSHDVEKYQRKNIPDVFLQIINGEEFVVCLEGSLNGSSSVSKYPSAACISKFFSIRHLHSLDDIDFSNALKELGVGAKQGKR